MVNKRFYCSRPSVVMELAHLGFKPKAEVNIYDPNYHNWSFELTPKLAKAVRKIYTDRNLQIPYAILSVEME